MSSMGREKAEMRGMKEAWEGKAVLRTIYMGWYRKVSSFLVPGNVVEIGSGIGNFKGFLPRSVSSDYVPLPWNDLCLDAGKLPFKGGALDNIVCINTLHHLQHHERFFGESERALRDGGRVVMFEPYAGISSHFVRKLFHQEESVFSRKDFGEAFEGDNSLPARIFFRDLEGFREDFPGLRVVHRSLHSPFLYLLSGGFRKRGFLTEGMLKPLVFLERLARPFNRVLAFKMLVVIEKCSRS